MIPLEFCIRLLEHRVKQLGLLDKPIVAVLSNEKENYSLHYNV